MTQAQKSEQKGSENQDRPNFGPDNLEAVVGPDNILTIRVDLDRSVGTTAGGNLRIASTGGNRTIDSMGTKLGLNVYRKA